MAKTPGHIGQPDRVRRPVVAHPPFLSSVLVIARTSYRADSDEGIHRLTGALAARCDTLRLISLNFELPEYRGVGWREFRPAHRGWQTVGDVATYTLSMPWSPSDTFGAVARWLTTPALEMWAGWPSRELDAAASSASVVVLHSEPALVLLGRLRRVAPQAKIVIYADDPQAAANMHPRLRATLARNCSAFDHVIVTARSMVKHYEVFGQPVSYVPRGLDLPNCIQPAAREIAPALKIVCTAAATLDASVVQIAADALPGAELHLVGLGTSQRYPANVRTHAPMSRDAFASLVAGARIGIVAPAGQADADGFADMDTALLYFGHLGLPTVCPDSAVGGWPFRFGYQPGRSASIRDALARALKVRPGSSRVPVLSWPEVAHRVIEAVEPRQSRESATARVREAAYEG